MEIMNQWVTDNIVLVIILGLWELVWKLMALWKSARLNQPVWFILLAILNTVGILPIIYLLIYRNKKTEVVTYQEGLKTSKTEP